jgi:multiple sugar transport system substrate-binding protein
MIERSWMPSHIEQPIQDSIIRIEFENQIGFLPMLPVPDKSNQTATLMGGWEFGISNTSLHKDLAWKLITEMLEPNILTPWLVEQSFLPKDINRRGGGPRSQTAV